MSQPKPMKKTATFGEAFAELERITEDLESETIDLDVAIGKFERGLELSRQLKDRLESVEQRVEKIREKFSGLGIDGAEGTEPEEES